MLPFACLLVFLFYLSILFFIFLLFPFFRFNTKSTIRIGTDNGVADLIYDTSVRVEKVIQQYWVTLANNVLSVGKGTTVGTNTFLSSTVSFLASTLYVALSGYTVPVAFVFDTLSSGIDTSGHVPGQMPTVATTPTGINVSVNTAYPGTSAIVTWTGKFKSVLILQRTE